MTFFEQEMRKFFKEEKVFLEPVFHDKTLLCKINKEINIKISFHNFGYADHYTGFLLQIINKKLGVIDSQTFKFGDILFDSTKGQKHKNPYIWVSGNDVSWYYGDLNKTEKEKILNVIKDYVLLYS